MSLRQSLAKFAVNAIGRDTFGSILAQSGMATSPRLGSKQLLRAYGTMPWLRATTQKVGWSVATNQWQLFVAQSGGKAIRSDILAKSTDSKTRHALIRKGLKAGDLREIETNAFIDFMAAGTPPFFDGIIGMALTQTHQDLVGECLWVLERKAIGGAMNRGTPLMYWVIPPSWITSVASESKPFFKIDGPYGSRDVHRDDCVWQYHPKPDDPYTRGTGMGHTLGDELETDEFSAKYLKSFFYNDARPPFLVSIDGADQKEVDRIGTWWNTKHQGFGRWWKPAFMGKKVDVHEFGGNFREMQIIELRKFQRDIVMQVYGFPPEIFGIVESSNRATAEAAKGIYAEHVVTPRLEMERSRRQKIATTEFDERLIVDFISPIPADKEHQLKVMTAISYAFQMDEVREAGGHAELPDDQGKVHMVPFNVEPRKNLSEGDPVDDIDVDDPDVTGEEEIGVGGTVALPTLSLNGSQISSLIEILLLVATEQLPRDSGLNLIMIAFNIDADSAEDIMGDIGATFFIEEPVDVDAGKVARASLKQRVLSKAAGPVQKISEKDIPRIVNRITPEQIGKKAAPVLKDAVKHFGARAIVEVGSDITFNMRSPKVERFLKSWAGDRIGKKVNATTKDALRSALVEGVKAGESTKQLSARVAGVFDDARSWRSDAIARTEMGRASNFGSLEGMVQAGIEEKEWLTTQDDQTRDSHSDMDGQVVAIDAEFESPNGGTAQYPGDFGEAEEDANCRCTVLSHVGKASRGAQWKATEAERKPFDKALRRALRLGFDAQETAVRAAL